jgi:glycosyltransferase involved in cell wall biosynthesis
MEISIILPVYNEEENLRPLFKELLEVLEGNFTDFEVIFVDDGSQDSSLEILKDLGEENEEVKWIELRKNFGQSYAIQAGLDQAEGDIIATMDSDMQNDPKDIPRLISELENTNSDMVCGWRKKRNDPFLKGMSSRLASFLRRLILRADLHDYGCTLKVFRKEAAQSLSLRGEMHRYIPPLLKVNGFKVSEIEVNHRQRHAGKTKYGLRRLPKGFMDMIKVWFWKDFDGRPLHIFGGLGLISIVSGGMFFLIALYQKMNGTTLSETASTIISVFLLLIGVQFFLSGILAEIVLKDQDNCTKNYKVRKVVK